MAQAETAILSTVEEIIEDARQGRMFILVDDEDRENEGDLVIPAEMATAEVVNFMAKYGRGLICLSMTRNRVEELGLQMMAQRNQAQHSTAFTVSIEAREGVTTGISAADRARTIQVAIDPACGRDDVVSPGHIFPLMAQDGGVLVRAGHTEAAVDVARLAGLNPSGVICEIMNDDGSMARMPDLITFAKEHGLKIGTIADLIAYRRRKEKLVEQVASSKIQSRFGGEFEVRVYANKIGYSEHLAIVRGDVSGNEPVYVRVHQHNILADSLGDTTASVFFRGEARSRAGELESAMKVIAEKGRGVIILIREPTPTTISRFIKEREGHALSKPVAELRQYGIGAQMLQDLGVKNMILLTNSSHKIIGIEGYGIHMVGQAPLPEVK
jgi:3,4-dihydroxy 2-butanone 4-phosphate synthase/GTP cyclohydrolase II